MINAKKYKHAATIAVGLTPGLTLKSAMELPGFEVGAQFDNEKVRLIDELIVEGKIVVVGIGNGWVADMSLLFLGNKYITVSVSNTTKHSLQSFDSDSQKVFTVYPR